MLAANRVHNVPCDPQLLQVRIDDARLRSAGLTRRGVQQKFIQRQSVIDIVLILIHYVLINKDVTYAAIQEHDKRRLGVTPN
jgi:hypothetical protein